MPSDQLHGRDGLRPVLSRIAEAPGLGARFASVDRIRDLYQRVRQNPSGFRLENLLEEMRVTIQVDAADQERIPASGPVVVVANHPYGMLDGAILTVLLTRVRADVKILTNLMLADVPELQRHCIFVDPFETDRSVEANRRPLREALSWLQRGGMLAVFPAGEVSHWQMPTAQIADPEWNEAAVRLIRHSRASALPVHFSGGNGWAFQILSTIHPRLRAAFLLQEFLQHAGKMVKVRIGREVPCEALDLVDSREATDYLRWRTYLLARRGESEKPRPFDLRAAVFPGREEDLAAPERPEALAEELARLPQERRLSENGDLLVCLAAAQEIPCLLREVGRLRELTFRKAGEGTGKSADLDRFDGHYWHLLLWNTAKRELVGAYRAGYTHEILPRFGLKGLYTSTLFRYDRVIFEKLGPALELGRSFVRPEYQRQYAPLLLLWKAIARMIALRPDVPVLFGAVSISNDYNAASREMIYRFFEARTKGDDLAGLAEPRRPFRPGGLRRWDCRSMCRALRDLDELTGPITDVEADGKGLPILLRQYAKIGGKMLAFNVDRKFSNVLDGLVVVDLRQTEPAVLDRYMGKEGAARFREFHAAAPGR